MRSLLDPHWNRVGFLLSVIGYPLPVFLMFCIRFVSARHHPHWQVVWITYLWPAHRECALRLPHTGKCRNYANTSGTTGTFWGTRLKPRFNEMEIFWCETLLVSLAILFSPVIGEVHHYILSSTEPRWKQKMGKLKCSISSKKTYLTGCRSS